MKASREHLEGLARLHRIVQSNERHAVFRQAMATLATSAADLRPVPLEGMDPIALRDAARVALATGLFDDLDWLSPAHASAAVYELAAALPSGDEKRELGRRVLRTLTEGSAPTFTLVATLLASGSRRGLSGPAVRARVATVIDLPMGSGVPADALALALLARRDLAEEWLVGPSTGSLPSRRLSARIFERAAREAARRAAIGDESSLEVFERPLVEHARQRLLADREPLVWRHIATARGLLAHAIPRFALEIDESLELSGSATDWRRAAASLAGSMAHDPEHARSRLEALLVSELRTRDRGIVGSMILGLARAAEAEPRATEELAAALVLGGGLEAVEAFLEIRRERALGEEAEWAARVTISRLRDNATPLQHLDDGFSALLDALETELSSQARSTSPRLRDLLSEATQAFVEHDARAASSKAGAALLGVQAAVELLESADETTREGRALAFTVLRELDATLFASSALIDLLTLGSREDRANHAAARAVDDVFDRLLRVLLTRELMEDAHSETVAHPTARVQRLRSLLRLVDADPSSAEDRSNAQRDRRLRALGLLLGRTREAPPMVIRRVVLAGLSRVCDALVREEVGELSDVVLAVAFYARNEDDFALLAEASMMPHTAEAFRACAVLARHLELHNKPTWDRADLHVLSDTVRHLRGGGAPRLAALRNALIAFGEALGAICDARSYAEVAGELDGVSPSLLVPLADAATHLAWLVIGTRRRFGLPHADREPTVEAAIRALDGALLRAARADLDASAVGTESGFDLGAMAELLEAVVIALDRDLPPQLAKIGEAVLSPVLTLPARAKRKSLRPMSRGPREAALPPWMPPSRTLGGFYVLRALGVGAVGSVFVARRVEERQQPGAPKFALKVPEYGGSAARTLSEKEFLQLFRDEAGALLAIPAHENLAKLVTFDVGSKPKPILVMELIEGPTLERIIETQSFDMPRACRALRGIASGLSAMHTIEVGHLDLKPSNVILRDVDGPGPLPEVPVLVDFGLSGRNIRPGCATSGYGAPEVWGLIPKGHAPRPMPVDVYAFACLAFELLTGAPLFSGANDLAIVSQHLQHDGDLPPVIALSERAPTLAPIAEAIGNSLRRDPRDRITIGDWLHVLDQHESAIGRIAWPVAFFEAAE